MLLGVILMFCFGVLRIFGGNHTKKKTGKSRQKRAPTSRRGEPMSRRRPTPRRGTPLPRRGQGVKMVPLGYAAENAYTAA